MVTASCFYAHFSYAPDMYVPEQLDVKKVIQDTTTMLKDVDPAMAAQLENISPEQQKELEAQLGTVFKKMETLSPEEIQYLEQHPEAMFDFVEKTVAEEPVAAPTPTPVPTPSIPAQEKKTETKPIVPSRPAHEILKTAELLEKIISITEDFIVKITTLKLEERIDRWAEKNKIKNWQSGLTYKTFKDQLLTFVKKIRVIKEEQDPETKLPVYVNFVIKNSALLNNLQKLYTTLSDQWQLITTQEEETDSLIQKLTRETKQALRSMLDTYAQALMNIPPQLDAIIKSYGPRAKELLEKEKELSERALKERKSPPAHPIRGLSPSYGRDGYQPSYPTYEYPGYPGYPAGTEYGYPYGGYPETASQDQAKPEKPVEPGGKWDKEEAGEKEKRKRPKDHLPEEKKKFALDELKNVVSTFEDNVKKTEDDIKNGPSAYASAVLYADRAIQNIDSAKHFLEIVSKKDQKTYKKKIADAYGPHKDFFDGIIASLDATIRRSRPRTDVDTSHEAAAPIPPSTPIAGPTAVPAATTTPLEEKRTERAARAARQKEMPSYEGIAEMFGGYPEEAPAPSTATSPVAPAPTTEPAASRAPEAPKKAPATDAERLKDALEKLKKAVADLKPSED
jgi:hypothetical protein